MTQIPFIGHHIAGFPATSKALEDPNGLLAAGGDLEPETLIEAYRRGIFPWYEADQPILWWSPAPRAVFYPNTFKASKSLQKVLRKKTYRITCDTAFAQVIKACSLPRPDSEGTWITSSMINAYIKLHQLGYAHSIETWSSTGELVGGLYGISLGSVFFGESMFSTHSNASKVAFCHLVDRCLQKDIKLIDCQVENPHLTSLGAIEISRKTFEDHLSSYIASSDSLSIHQGCWSTTSTIDSNS